MGKVLRLALALILLVTAYQWLYRGLWESRSEVRLSTQSGYVLPSKFSRVLALEYDGLLADYQFLKLVTFIGERILHEQGLNDEDWDYVVSALKSITSLDPYFLDPYILAESFLTWEGGRIEDANELLRKGMEYRKTDWQLPFYLGFNYFYFLKDAEQGAEYLMQASKLPGSPGFLPNLASRLGYYGNKTKTAIVFLKGILAQTSDPKLQKYIEIRVKALERASLIEEKVAEYTSEVGAPPGELDMLVESGYLDVLPEDPYGGDWILMDNGRVFSTSRFVKEKRAGSVNSPDP